MHALRRPARTAKEPVSSASEQKKLNASDRVIAAITDGILRRRYVPGQRLIELDLTHEFKVSRGTIREAFKRLAAEGVVALTPHRGAYVRSMTREAAKELLVVLEYLTPLMAGLAAERIGKANHRQRFQRALASLLGFRGNGHSDQFVEERRRFYRLLLDIGGNSELMRVMPLTHIQMFRMQFHPLMSPDDLGDQFAEYQEIGKAILGGDARAAERLMRRHIRRTQKRVMELPEQAFSPAEDGPVRQAGA